MNDSSSGLAHSIQVRLLQHARKIQVDPNLVLTRFAVERFLYRLACSPYANRFVLKGGLLLLVWLGETIRPTRDADLLGLGDITDESLIAMVRTICSLEVESDGMSFLEDSVRIEAIRPEDVYGGRRITLQAHLGSARLKVQVDVGLGDAVVPEAEWLNYPTLLGLPSPRLRAYRPETMIAEKVQAMVLLGSKNSRMRDFFDIDALATRQSFEGRLLTAAVRATFARRSTALPETIPLALTPEFGATPEKQTQWRAFCRKSGVTTAPENFQEVVERLAVFLVPVLEAARSESRLRAKWSPGGPWQQI
jgi:hypothetical protein